MVQDSSLVIDDGGDEMMVNVKKEPRCCTTIGSHSGFVLQMEINNMITKVWYMLLPIATVWFVYF